MLVTVTSRFDTQCEPNQNIKSWTIIHTHLKYKVSLQDRLNYLGVKRKKAQSNVIRIQNTHKYINAYTSSNSCN